MYENFFQYQKKKKKNSPQKWSVGEQRQHKFLRLNIIYSGVALSTETSSSNNILCGSSIKVLCDGKKQQIFSSTVRRWRHKETECGRGSKWMQKFISPSFEGEFFAFQFSRLKRSCRDSSLGWRGWFLGVPWKLKIILTSFKLRSFWVTLRD